MIDVVMCYILSFVNLGHMFLSLDSLAKGLSSFQRSILSVSFYIVFLTFINFFLNKFSVHVCPLRS